MATQRSGTNGIVWACGGHAQRKTHAGGVFYFIFSVPFVDVQPTQLLLAMASQTNDFLPSFPPSRS